MAAPAIVQDAEKSLTHCDCRAIHLMMDLEAKLQSYVTVPNQGIVLGLERVEALLAKLGNPHLQLPPVIHVAGTNGKGSTIAFMRAMLEAGSKRVHVFTSPHLIHFNERIRIAGRLVTDAELLSVFKNIAHVNGDAPITYFEMTTVAAFVLFARTLADVLLLEVGLGGRLDATNVITPAVSVITRISFDHTHLLGDTLEKIAGEKAGIVKSNIPVVLAYQADENVKNVIRMRAAELNAPLHEYGKNSTAQELSDGFLYNQIKYPPPALLGAHQILNAANAITAVRLFMPEISDAAVAAGLQNVEWPGRLQHITSGALAGMLPANWQLWYDGAHNDSGAESLAEQCRRWKASGAEIHLVIGMLKTKDPSIFSELIQMAANVVTIPVVGSDLSFPPDALAGLLSDAAGRKITPAASLETALHQCMTASDEAIDKQAKLLICGSLYLASAIK